MNQRIRNRTRRIKLNTVNRQQSNPRTTPRLPHLVYFDCSCLRRFHLEREGEEPQARFYFCTVSTLRISFSPQLLDHCLQPLTASPSPSSSKSGPKKFSPRRVSSSFLACSSSSYASSSCSRSTSASSSSSATASLTVSPPCMDSARAPPESGWLRCRYRKQTASKAAPAPLGRLCVIQKAQSAMGKYTHLRKLTAARRR